MKKAGTVLACGALLLLLGSGIAGAQTPINADLSKGWDLRAGIFVPERQAARAAEGDVWFTMGAERAVYEVDRWIGSISIDYYGSGRVYNVPITINLRGNTHKLRYGAGAGVGISHDLDQGILGFTYHLLVGYELMAGNNPIAFDVRYLWQSTGHGALNGWAFTLGYHF